MQSQQASRYNEAALALEKKHCYAQSGHNWESIDLRLLEENWTGLIETADIENIWTGASLLKWVQENINVNHVIRNVYIYIISALQIWFDVGAVL